MQGFDFKKWLYIYLVISRFALPETDLQYQLFFRLFTMPFEDQSVKARKKYKKEFDDGLEESIAQFKYFLPKSITEKVEDWKGFAVGRIDADVWELIKNFYEETYGEKFDMKKAGMY